MDDNPYAPPVQSSRSTEDVVDRQQRDALAATVRQFLREEITAFELDKSLDAFRDSNDSAVRFVCGTVWSYYDDCDDHLVAMSKPAWDYFQRLLLLLESDRRIATVRTRRWSATQLVALAALIGFAAAVWNRGWPSYARIAIAAPFGLVSIAIAWFRRPPADANPYAPLLYPFGSFGELRSAYEAVGFRKMRCPATVRSRRIRPAYVNWLLYFQFHAGWAVVSPAVLAAQTFPATETRVRIVAD